MYSYTTLSLRKVRYFSVTVYPTTGAYCEIFYSFYPFLSSHTYLRTLFNARRSSRSPIAIRNPRSRARMARIGHLAPTLIRTTMNTALYLPIHFTFASLSARAVCSLTCMRALFRSFSPYLSSSVGPKWRRWRLITTQSPLPVRPGLRPVPRKQQPPFAALGHSPPRYRCCKTNNLRPVCRGKKEHRSPRFPPSFRQITGGPTDRPTTGIRGIHRGGNSRDSTLAEPIEGRGKHALNPRRQLPRRHDTARNANA